jgi:hypothetical protein
MDYLAIGARPAGPQLGYFLQRNGRDYPILEAGRFFRTFPRHRTLISINKPHTPRMDWNSLVSDDPRLLFTNYGERYFPAAGVTEDLENDRTSRAVHRLPLREFIGRQLAGEPTAAVRI